ncbi:hypothetical protein ACS0TY_006528 [Phlomoides rotata]
MGKSTAIRIRQSRQSLKRSRTQLNDNNVEDGDIAAGLAAAHTQLDALEERLKNMEASLNAFMRVMNFDPPYPPSAAPAVAGILTRMDELRTTLDNMEANMDAFFRFIN